jgi:hypothetical protein
MYYLIIMILYCISNKCYCIYPKIQTYYRWNPEIEPFVCEEFKTTLQTRLKGMAYDNYNRKSRPVFMSPTLYEDFKKKREDIKAGTRAAINKANKSKAGPSTHRFGCISAAEHAKRMVKSCTTVLRCIVFSINLWMYNDFHIYQG